MGLGKKLLRVEIGQRLEYLKSFIFGVLVGPTIYVLKLLSHKTHPVEPFLLL
jgi:hypothetical protein